MNGKLHPGTSFTPVDSNRSDEQKEHQTLSLHSSKSGSESFEMNGHASFEVNLHGKSEDQVLRQRKLRKVAADKDSCCRIDNSSFLEIQTARAATLCLPRIETPTADQQLIGINGYWYDVAAFIPKHPGGEIIKEFVNRDATSVFEGFHTPSVLYRRRPIATYSRASNPFDQDMQQLHAKLYREGFYEIDKSFYLKVLCACLVLLFLVIALVLTQLSRDGTSWAALVLSAVLLAALWQQCGFMMHDSMHSQVFQTPYWDEWLGWLCGTVVLGLGAAWWKRMHIVHHSLTCAVDYETNFIDPQMHEEMWAEDEKLFPFFRLKFIHRIALKVQHITFLPLCMGVGRLYINVWSMYEEKNSVERLGFLLHFLWLTSLLSFIPTWSQVFCFYAIASFLQGILHVQLLTNHYAKPFNWKEDVLDKWYTCQVETNINVINPWWLDWFYGGLNYHIEHHSFPRLPRSRYRTVSPMIKAICAKHSVGYDECGPVQIITRTLAYLKNLSVQFELDPR